MILVNCKHNFVRSGYGEDVICTECGYAAMQARVLKPEITVNINTGSFTIDDIVNKVYEEMDRTSRLRWRN